jgi:hypothetical protein
MTDTAYTSGFRAGMQHAAELTYAENMVCAETYRADTQSPALDKLDTMPATRWTDEPHIVRGLE